MADKETKDTAKNSNKKNTTDHALKQVLDTAIYIVVIALVCVLINKFVAVRTVVYGSSMYDTLEDGDNLIMDKISYRFRTPKRFDVVVFQKENSTDNRNLIKRVIGLPGETVQIIGGYVYINGEKLETDVYGTDLIHEGYTADEPIVLGEDEYFCLGDNRNNSKDSRFAEIGPVKKSEILGRAWVRIYPFNKICLVDKIE